MIKPDKRLDEYMFYDRQDAYSAYRNLDLWIKKVSYVRLQNLRLGYRLPEKVIRTLGMNSASVALEGRNLLVFGANYRNFLDPESMDNPFAAPVPKSITFSLNLNF